MNKDQTNGNVDQLKGEFKKQYGKLTNNESKEAEGNMDKFKGQAQEKWGDAKEALSKTFSDRRD
ncbi:CsbD family protein [Cytobacillus sp. FSL W8-0315]|uniref:CsbD family protein n=1 Tax=Cytobacillus TaxID=2675230 RepID=UPI00203B4C7E|nr:MULTISPECIES: CsbD family protein [Cytobacillus]MCM3394407.1 CsbD family protein [Cytobacillus oceanisediminis]UQX55882.1 CsbD family protein [Cytobacillus pseudoceanisediminis]